MHPQRTSFIREFFVNSVSLTSVLEIGDSEVIHGTTWALAVQREKELFFENEGDFQNYSVFTRSPTIEPITEKIMGKTCHLSPLIQVNRLNLTAISASSLVHIGSSRHISLESRVMNIRQLEGNSEPSPVSLHTM